VSDPRDPYQLPPPAGGSAQPAWSGSSLSPQPGQAPPVTPAGEGAARPLVHPEPQSYHRLLVARGYAWWRPLLGLAILGATFVALTLLVTIVFVTIDAVRTDDSFDQAFERFGTEVDPLFLLGTNLSLAVAIPAAALAIVVAHRLRPGWLSSVVGRLRWGLLARLAVLAFVVVVGFTLLGGFLPADDDMVVDIGDVELVSLSRWLTFAVVILLTTPLQSAAEEYAFRGYAFQALSAWFRTPWIGALATSLAFAFAHGTQNMPLFLDRLAFGLVACWLVVRTGGLEAAIALHAMNNIVIFLLTAAVDDIGGTLGMTAIPWPAVVLDMTQMVVFAWLADRHVRRRGHATRSVR
jgi:uncharacterized protein